MSSQGEWKINWVQTHNQFLFWLSLIKKKKKQGDEKLGRGILWTGHVILLEYCIQFWTHATRGTLGKLQRAQKSHEND